MIHQIETRLFFTKPFHADALDRKLARKKVKRRNHEQEQSKEKALPHGLDMLLLRECHDLLIRFLFDLDFHAVVLPFHNLVEREWKLRL